jgi:hypothetical protein
MGLNFHTLAKLKAKNIMEIKNYSEKCFIVIGEDTRDNREELKTLGGRYNRYIKGWVFSNKKRKSVEEFVSYGHEISTKQNEQRMFADWLVCSENIDKIIKAVKCSIGVTSTVEDEIDKDAKSYKFYGHGCGISFLKIDGRCKRINKIYDGLRHFQQGTWIYGKLKKAIGMAKVKEMEREGFPIMGLFLQDQLINYTYMEILRDYLITMCGAKESSIELYSNID